MPKKIIISKEQKAADNFFNVNESNLKNTTEKQEKPKVFNKDLLRQTVEKTIKDNPQNQEIIKSTIEKKYSKPSMKFLETIESIPKKKYKRKAKKSSKRKTTKAIQYTAPKLLLKKNGYELIITEKPQAALKIASALGVANQKNMNKVPYYEVDRKGKKIIVACAVGHLFTLKQNVAGTAVPIFDISWMPNYLARKKDFTKRYYDTLLKLAKNAGSLTVATDFDIEGEVIGFNVVRFICGQKDAKRMKFSTLTSKELNEAYENKLPTIEWGQAIAGETRHYLDWFYGINLSRALMNAIKTTGKFKIMSIGRVQGPALNLVVKREKEISKFEPQTYWQVFIIISDDKNKLELKYTKDIFDKSNLARFDDLVGKTAIAELKKSQQIIPPNPPFNLTTLQTECYKLFGITPTNTLRAAQSLYLAGLISYPRTSSQKLPDSIDYKSILDILKIRYKVAKLITKDKPIEGKKSDPAHPSIHPTGNKQVLSGHEEKVYDLIVKRFLSLFCDDAIIDKKRISAKVNDLTFSANGSQIQKKAWMEIYPAKLKEVDIPDMNGEVKIIDKKVEEKQTQPPKRYSPASILSELERKNLGTKATRSAILETLYDRGYVKEKSIEATPLGISLIETLEKYSPIIIDEELTRDFENEMNEISEAEKDFEKAPLGVPQIAELRGKEKIIINKAKKTITEIAKQFENSQKAIGKELVEANVKAYEQEKEANKICKCPVCKIGDLAITYSKKNRSHFIACNAYPNCKTTYSLPPQSKIKKTDKVCEHCGFPLLMALKPGRKPWFFCFNKNCESNRERLEKYYEKKSQGENA